MKPVRKNTVPSISDIRGGNIPVNKKFAEVFQLIEKRDLTALFQNFRFDLQGRIVSLDGDNVIKLQGKLEYVDELEKFFEKLVLGKS